ncbi:hypothetical protein NC651_028566 [Populus alba x Populus x berolinensis]|nr:hypothetical protein NC651_028566 [Populus alba x Populus x berolinensis]
MGEENFPDLVPWLFDSLKTDNSNVERSGAAQGLSETKAINLKMNTCYDYDVILPEENTSFRNLQTSFNQVLSALGTGYFEHVLPDIIRNCSYQKASVRDGYLTLFKYLPRSLGVQFQNYLQQVLPAILDGRSLPLLLPAVEDGIFNDNRRIRQSSVELLGDLLFKVAGTSGKALLEGGSDDEGSSTEAYGRAIIEVLGRDKRNEILAALYMVRTDVSLSMRQAALHVWKAIMANTTKTFKEIMPVLMNTLISSLASASSERQQVVAARALSELVRKLGERGVCIGLSEVMASAVKSQLLSFMDELIPIIRTALCDSKINFDVNSMPESAGMQAIDEIVPTLLHALEDDETSDTTLDGLKQVLRTTAVLPHNLPALLSTMAFTLVLFFLLFFLQWVLRTRLSNDWSLYDVQTLAKEAAETVALVIDEEGVEYLIVELLKGVGDTLLPIRRSSSYLIGFFFKYSKLYLVDEAPNMISALIILLSDSDSSTVKVAWEALSRVIGSVPKKVLPLYIKLVRDAVSMSRDKERRKKKGGPVVIPVKSRTVRTSPAFALGKLSALSTRVDPLVSDLLSSLQASDASVREAILTALKEPQLDDLLELLSNLASSPSWVSRHGSVLTISSLLRHNPSFVVTSQMFPSIIHCLKDALKDEKFPLHELQRRRRLILHQIQSDPTEATAYVDIISIIVSALHDDSNEVRRRGLFALKAVAKGSPPSITVHVSIIGLALAKGLKDSSTPVQTLFKLLKNLLQALLGDFQSSLNIETVVRNQGGC